MKRKPKYRCLDCDYEDTSEYGLDKCPDCGGDDWENLRG